MRPEDTDIFTAVAEWLVYCEQRFSKRTCGLSQMVIKNFVKSLPESIETIGQLCKEYYEQYIEILTANFAKNTLRNYRGALRRFHHWIAYHYGIKDFMPKLRTKSKQRKLPILKAPDDSDALEEWLEYCQRFVKNTQQRYRVNLVRFIEYAGIENIGQINSRLIEKYISHLLGKGKKNSTINTNVGAIRSFCRWIARIYDVPNFTAGIQDLKEEPTEARFLTWDEYEKILSVAEGKYADIVKFLANTGLRSAELINSKWGNVSKDLKMLTVFGKGRKKRYVPLNDVCREVLQKYERGPDNSCLHFMRFCTDRKTLYRNLVKLSKKAEIPKAAAHSYRHLFATEMLHRGADIYYVSKILGHSNVLITQKTYEHFIPGYFEGKTDLLVACKK